MLLRLGSLLGGGLLLTALGACSDDASDGGDSNGRAGAGEGGVGGAGRGGAAGTAAQAGLGGGAGSGNPRESRWDDCGSAEDYVGDDAWSNLLEVTTDAVYCATFDESRTLKEELAKKAMLRIAPGSYRLPSEAAENLGLPACIAYGAQGRGVPTSPDGIAYTATPLSAQTIHRYAIAAVAPDPERRLALSLDQLTEADEHFRFTLNGGPNDVDSFDSDNFSLVLCQGLGEPCYVDRVFDSCTHEASRLHRHQVTMETGELVLDLRLGGVAATQAGAFVRAAGTFRGHDLEQSDYFRLIYKPGRHHFIRNFAVLFDAPIAGACGLEISGFSASGDLLPEAYAVDCELDRLETLSATDVSLIHDP